MNDHKTEWPDVNTAEALDRVTRALKPGGILLLVDHSAKAGTGRSAASSLHRIDETFAMHDFESRGLKLVAKSDVLRRPDDGRELVSYKGPWAKPTVSCWCSASLGSTEEALNVRQRVS